MFYNEQMQQNSVLSVPWQLGTNQIPLKQVDLPKVCSTLKKWMDVDIDKKKHISLRTNAILLHGTLKMYRDKANEVWEDCIRLYNEISRRKLPRDFFTEEDPIIDSTAESQLNASDQSQNSSQETSELPSEKSSPERTSQRNSSKQINTSAEQSQCISQEPSEFMAEKSSLETTPQRKRSKQLDTSEEDLQRSSPETSPSLAEVSSLERISQRTSSKQLDTSDKQSQRISQETLKQLSEATNPGTSRPISSAGEDNINTRKRRKIEKRSKIVPKDVQRSSANHNIQFSGSLEMCTENAYVISREERLRYARWNLNEKSSMAMVLTFGKTIEPEDIIFANIVK